jgi:hypothetical protein
VVLLKPGVRFSLNNVLNDVGWLPRPLDLGSLDNNLTILIVSGGCMPGFLRYFSGI